MTQEEKQLLLKDLCARLPYGVKLEITVLESNKTIVEELDYMWLGIFYSENPYHIIKPYLRPMSSIASLISAKKWTNFSSVERIDWYNANHIDYRSLIEKGLALEAPKDMYGKI